MDIRLANVPKESYNDYRLDVIFEGYKWDLQETYGSGTICDKVVLMGAAEAAFLAEQAVLLYHETVQMERELKKHPNLVLEMGISQEMTDALCKCEYNPAEHVRFMRFDFHPTKDGWRISEVNSDVPAGYPESSVLPALAAPYFENYKQYGCFGDVFAKRLSALLPAGANITYIHDTHTVEDYQILHYLGD
ncbi:MAG: glutathionylspermidine synthase family protein, partial [Defluviitaleaceae bacterium]|nr:glutathionylspermidine synthase family protein [Defluviitaleaceae bacterium]